MKNIKVIKVPGILKLQSIFLGFFMILFSIILITSLYDLKYKFSYSWLSKSFEDVSTEFFINVMASEISLYSPNTDQSNISLPRELFSTVLNIWPEDIRTFLGRELPGFSTFNTEIAVAGIGTNLTTLPVESPPPLEILLKEREQAEAEISEANNEENPPANTPSLKTEKDAVFIYHSHSWEAFLPLLGGNKTANEAVSLSETKNVIAVGNKLKEELAERGIGANQSKANVTEELKKKNWNYNQSYILSRELVQEAMAQEESIQYLIDIHRDSQNRELTTTQINGKDYARLFFIVGKENKNYERNLALAKELNQKLEEKYPGISRGVFIKTKDDGNGVYNQDLSSQSMLLEFGGVENNSMELDHSIEAFAEVFSEYFWKAEEVSGTGN